MYTKIAENRRDYILEKQIPPFWLLAEVNFNNMFTMHMHPKNQAGKNSLVRNLQPAPPAVETIAMRKIYRLHEIRDITEDTYVMRFDRNGMPFRAGQHITLGIPGNNQVREYSIYSTEHDNALEVLIKEVETGSVSKQLSKAHPRRTPGSGWAIRIFYSRRETNGE